MLYWEFVCYINPPTKNEKKMIQVYSRKAKRKIPIVSKEYSSVWDFIQSQMELRKLKVLTKQPITISLFNGFKRMDLMNFETELFDRLQGIVYCNDKQIKEAHFYKDDNAEKEYFKIIIEEYEK